MLAFAYVCVVSEFLLPTLEACLSVRPRLVVMIASSHTVFEAAAKRLQVQLEEAGMAVKVLSEHSTGERLDGDDIEANAGWLRRHLVPLLQQWQHEGLHCVANLTGGTKAMALALFTCHPWHRLDYLPFGQPLQAVRHQPGAADEVLPFATLAAPAMQQASPMQVARLHNASARQLTPNPLRKAPGAPALAQRIWDGQQTGDAALAALWAGLDRVWSFQREQHQERTVTLPWQAFFPPDVAVDGARLQGVHDWLQSLQQLLAPSGAPALAWDECGITLPGNQPHKQGKHWRAWVSGDWLEQLAHHWLMQAGIPSEAVACNVTGGTQAERSDDQREADLLVHHRNITSLVEIKADLPPGKTPADLEQQVSSIGARFGKTRKALLLGPQLLQTLHDSHRARSFWLRCRANSVELLLRPQQLEAFVSRQPVWPGLNADDIPSRFA